MAGEFRGVQARGNRTAKKFLQQPPKPASRPVLRPTISSWCVPQSLIEVLQPMCRLQRRFHPPVFAARTDSEGRFQVDIGRNLPCHRLRRCLKESNFCRI